MQPIDEVTITEAVIARHAHQSSRVATLMTSLIRHLHDFAREVKLTEDEWFTAIQFLTEVGQRSDSQRQEFILLSDTLGLSMLVTAMNQSKPAGCTEATVLGPFHVPDSAPFSPGEDIARGAPGEPCFVIGRVTSEAKEPIANATVEVWQADADGFYDVQYGPEAEHRARGIGRTNDKGQIEFKTIVAEPYPIPADGPVGRMLEALGRHPWRPAHLHFKITAPGFETLTTHVFRAGARYLDSDAVFGVRSSLIGEWVRHQPGLAPDGTQSTTPFYTLDFTFVLPRSS